MIYLIALAWIVLGFAFWIGSLYYMSENYDKLYSDLLSELPVAWHVGMILLFVAGSYVLFDQYCIYKVNMEK